MYDVILAHDINGGIGKDNTLPWHLPKDLEYFKKITKHRPLVCASKTFYSLPKVVKARVGIIVSSKDIENPYNKECVSINNPAPELFEGTIVIGGSSLFIREIFEKATTIHETVVKKAYDCDTFIDINYFNDKTYTVVYEDNDIQIREY